jgi:hypothetical protein
MTETPFPQRAWEYPESWRPRRITRFESLGSLLSFDRSSDLLCVLLSFPVTVAVLCRLRYVNVGWLQMYFIILIL